MAAATELQSVLKMNRIDRILFWFGGGLVATAAVAWIAFQLQQQRIAPAVLFPLATGATLGGALLALRRLLQQPSRRLAVTSAIVWGLLLVVAQDYIGHRYRMRMFESELADGHPLAVAMASERDLAPTFADHLAARIRDQSVWWSLDLLLTASAAAVVVAVGLRARNVSGSQLPPRERPPSETL